MKVRMSHYRPRANDRILIQQEIGKIWDLFIYQKKSVKEIGVLLNLIDARINDVLFNGTTPFKNYDNRGVCAFGKQTAYCENEEQIAESFDPKYSMNDVDEKELA